MFEMKCVSFTLKRHAEPVETTRFPYYLVYFANFVKPLYRWNYHHVDLPQPRNHDRPAFI